MAGDRIYYGEGVFSKSLANGGRRFYAEYRWRGRRIAEAAESEERARELAKGRRAAIASDPDYVPPPARKPARTRESKPEPEAPRVRRFGELREFYDRELAPARRARNWQRWVSSRVGAEFDEVPLAEMSAARIESWRDALLARVAAGELTVSTVRKYVYFLSGIFSSALETAKGREMVSDNPCRFVALPPEPRGLKKALSIEQSWALVTAAEDDPPLRRWALVMLRTGVRTEEAMRLEWRDVDLRSGRLVIRATKTGAPRYAEAGDELLEELRAWHAEHEAARRAFEADPGQHREPSPRVIGQTLANVPHARWQVVFDLAEIPWGAGEGRFTPRNLRTTFAMLAFQNGARPEELVEQTGHSLETLMAYYAEASPEQRRRAVNAMPSLRRAPLRVAR